MRFPLCPFAALAVVACQPATDPANDVMTSNDEVAVASGADVPEPSADAPLGAVIDPASTDAAAELAESYGRALTERRIADAYAMWADGGRASGHSRREFSALFDGATRLALNIGKPSDPREEAGSTLVELPATLTGRDRTGKIFEISGPVVLRRLDEVNGAAQDQRNWHIAQAPFPPR